MLIDPRITKYCPWGKERFGSLEEAAGHYCRCECSHRRSGTCYDENIPFECDK